MKSLITATFRHWSMHNASRMGAALSYYAMLSFIPLLVLLGSAVSVFFTTELVEGTILTQLTRVLGDSAAQYIHSAVVSGERQSVGILTTLTSVGITLVGAIGIFSELDKDFDELWEVPHQTREKTHWLKAVKKFFQSKIIALSFVPILALLLGVGIALTLVLSALETVVPLSSIAALMVDLAQVVVPLVLGTLLFALMYRILPDRTLPWNIVSMGALITTLLFIAGNFLIIAYIKLFLQTSVFGAAASLVGLLVWVYYSAQVFFVGASFTFAYARKRGLIESDEKAQS